MLVSRRERVAGFQTSIPRDNSSRFYSANPAPSALAQGIKVKDSDNDDNHHDDSDGPSQMKKLGIYGAMGFEFVGLVVGGSVVGFWIDEKFGTRPWGVVSLILLGMFAALWHVYRVTKRFLK